MTTDAFRAKVVAKLANYRAWSAGRKLLDCRLVHYCGVDLVGAGDVLLSEVEARIEGLANEGFYSDWTEHKGRLYLRVWEFDGPVPAWPKVFAEQALDGVNQNESAP